MLSPRALCDLDDVRKFGYDPNDDDLEAELWISEINDASDEIHAYLNREVVSLQATRASANVAIEIPIETREFVVDEWVVEERCIDVGDMYEFPDEIRITEYDGTAVETVALGRVTALPLNRGPCDPIEQLEFLAGLADSAPLFRTYRVEVDSRWGFPEIPARVRGYAAKQAALWFDRDVKAFSTTFDTDTNRITVPNVLDPAIRRGLQRLRRSNV